MEGSGGAIRKWRPLTLLFAAPRGSAGLIICLLFSRGEAKRVTSVVLGSIDSSGP